MSLITQCPVCGTLFKVVQDQLKISEGWVRCGQCAEVFDSNLKLRELDLDPMGRSETVAQEPLSQEPVELFFEPEPELGTATPLPVAVEGAGSEGQLRRQTLSEPASFTEQADFSFIPNRQVASVWTGSWVRAGLVCMVFLLLLGLGGQLIFHERDRLAAADSRLNALLKGVCRQLHCAVLPWRQIESIAVESSSFNKLRANAYELSFVITNAADTELARPALELTLTDSQDRPLLRRVLLPSELDSQRDVLSAHGEWTGRYVVAIASNIDTLAKNIAGYRIMAFYP